MENYPTITFGEYKGRSIDQIPLRYLIWLHSKLHLKKKDKSLYKAILHYFLSKNIRIEDHRNKAQGYHFYFNDHKFYKVGGGKKCFMQSFSKMINSKGENVYEVGNPKTPIFLVEKTDHLEIDEINYVSATYKFGGLTMIYERNPHYYFYDGYGIVMKGAYLMRKPWIPDGQFLSGDFSENLPIENLEKQL